ncbi:MAG: molybdate ABC transporter substrate-binding protein [Desulfarculus sp.]|nr:molybdate ABC transporter substrate-binding protein [Desulfarculus sp.]
MPRLKSLAVMLVLSLAAALAFPPPAQAGEFLVSAAASLREALQEAGQAFQAQHPGTRVAFNFGASGALASQIEQGAPVDVFASANQEHMERLNRQGLLLPQTRRDFTANALVLIQPGDGAALSQPQDLLSPQVRRLALGDPATVPAGQYAKQALTSLQLWEALRPKLVLAADVRQVREYVLRGEVEAGLVFASDMARKPGAEPPRARVALTLAPGLHAPILYPAAVLKGSRQPQKATAFLDFLVSPPGQAILARWGFQAPR